jgi:hypothetical protein
MAPRYNLIADCASPDSLQTVVPFWVVSFARFATPVTYDPMVRGSRTDVDPVGERDPLVVTNDAIFVQVGASKDAHVTNLQVGLNPGTRNYLQEVLPGDWVFCSMLASESEGKRVAEKYRKGQAVNGWKDGLKFIGRVKTVRKRIQRNSSTGELSISFQVSAVGFSEFDTPVIYHPQLQKAQSEQQGYAEFGAMVEDIIRGSDDSVNKDKAVDINRVIPKFVRVIFGEGAFSAAGNLAGVKASPNEKYLIPRTVAKWLGNPIARTFADIVGVMMGVQHYRTAAGSTDDKAADPWKLFLPDGLSRGDDQVLRTGRDLIGVFPLQPPPMDGQPVWSVLGAYLSAPVNEMYVALRPSQDFKGALTPYLVVRQTPYSTPQVHKALLIPENKGAAAEGWRQPDFTSKPEVGMNLVASDLDTTDFTELPRWVLPSDLLISVDVGRSDALRVNLVHVSGTGPGALRDEVGAFWRSPPNIDDLDIKRHGVRPYMPSVNCYLTDHVRGPTKWRDLMTDIVMGQHLTLNGTITSAGIQAAVQPGDNLELDGIVFHIESLAHVCTIDAEGNRQFSTTFQVSHGVQDEEIAEAYQQVYGLDERTSHFAGIADGSDVGMTSNATVEDDGP